MEKHAFAILTEAESSPLSRIQILGNQGGKFKAMTPKLLHGFIAESQQLGGTLLDQFWDTVGKCHPMLRENVKNLKQTEFSAPNHSESVLFEGLDRRTIDFRPVFQMATELFTHLCVAFMNLGGRESGSGSPFSVSEMIGMDTDSLLSAAASQGFGIREQTALKALLFKRDGFSCPLTGARFDTDDGVDPILAHVIPSSVHGKPDTMKCIAMLAGTAVRDLVLQQLNGLGNLMNLESNAHTAYNNIKWAIEGRDTNGEIEYIYRRVPHSTTKGPGFIHFRDGDRITFGRGLEAARLGSGPHPLLCNLRLAVARVLKMSGAAEVIAQMVEDGNDSDFPHVYIASPDFCNILTAKLLVSGRALVQL